MDSSRRIIWTVVGVALVVAAVVFLYPGAKESFAPALTAARVAIQPAGAEAAVVGPVQVPAGTAFTLHAVLEARDRDGSPVYYTRAPALEIDGRRVPAEALRTWDRPWKVKVFWFTVEGPAPYLKLEAPGQLDRFRFTEFFRPEWPADWSAPGRLEARFSEGLAKDGGATPAGRSFGTQRYQVRIELFEHDDDLMPTKRFISPGGDALPDQVASFPTVYASLPGAAAGAASLAFGLTEIEPPAATGTGLLHRLADLTRRHLAFSRVTLLHGMIEAAGRESESLDWRRIDLDDGPAWGGSPAGVHAGDLLRVGARVVVLYQDRPKGGIPGRLDRQDLCFDYAQGAAVEALSAVFTGEGLVELARL